MYFRDETLAPIIEIKYRPGAINVVKPSEWTGRIASDLALHVACPMSLRGNDFHIAVSQRDLFHLSRIAPNRQVSQGNALPANCNSWIAVGRSGGERHTEVAAVRDRPLESTQGPRVTERMDRPRAAQAHDAAHEFRLPSTDDTVTY